MYQVAGCVCRLVAAQISNGGLVWHQRSFGGRVNLRSQVFVGPECCLLRRNAGAVEFPQRGASTCRRAWQPACVAARHVRASARLRAACSGDDSGVAEWCIAVCSSKRLFLQPRIDRFALERQHSEHTLVCESQRLLADKAFKRSSLRRHASAAGRGSRGAGTRVHR